MKTTAAFEIYARQMSAAGVPCRGWKHLNPKERAGFEAFIAELFAAGAAERAHRAAQKAVKS